MVLPFHISLLIKVPPTPILVEIDQGSRERRLTYLPFLFLDRYTTCHCCTSLLSSAHFKQTSFVIYVIYIHMIDDIFHFFSYVMTFDFHSTTNCVLMSFTWWCFSAPQLSHRSQSGFPSIPTILILSNQKTELATRCYLQLRLIIWWCLQQGQTRISI